MEAQRDRAELAAIMAGQSIGYEGILRLMVNARGMTHVLSALVNICYDQRRDERNNGSANMAEEWHKDAKAIELVMARVRSN